MLAGHVQPARAGFFDAMGTAFSHLGQMSAGHTQSYAQAKPAPGADKPVASAAPAQVAVAPKQPAGPTSPSARN